MNFINEQIWNAYIFQEGIEEFKTQAKNILKRNGIDSPDGIVNDLQKIIDDVEQEKEPDIKSLIKGDHIISLAFMYLSGITSYQLLKTEYGNYIDTYMLSKPNELSKMAKEILDEIKQKKLFKDFDAKMELINQKVNSFVSELHANYTPTTKSNTNIDKEDSEDIVYEDDDIVVYLADSRLKCIKYGEPHLCISWKYSNNYYWRYRMGKMRSDDLGMTTYFVTNKNDDDKYLIDALGDESGPANKYSYNPINPNRDSDVSKQELLKKHPELEDAFAENVFKFIPYGEDEKRFHYIEENVESITSEELKDKEDYWMFIESGKTIKPDEWSEIPQSLRKDALVKYISVGENFNIPDELLDTLPPTDRKNYQMNLLKSAKDYFSRMFNL